MTTETTTGELPHRPVLLNEVLELLAPRPGERILDATLGRGGHARALLEAVRIGLAGASAGPLLLGVDRDTAALEAVQRGWPAPLLALSEFVQARFSELTEHPATRPRLPVDVVLADLGVSSPQLDESERGFTFQRTGPLDMRMDASRGRSARELLVACREAELARILSEYGEERFARRIAAAIKRALAEQPRTALTTTTELAELVRRTVPLSGKGKGSSKGKPPRIHPATRTFQALRIAVNEELDELDALLRMIPDVLKPGGRMAIISFHSLEDRRVKHAFRDLATSGEYELLTKKPRTASEAERAANPRARSAKLRALCRKPAGG